MYQVHQHPDGLVYVRQDGDTRYSDTIENFQDDFKITLPPLPSGADERIYEPGKRHAVQNRETIIEGGPTQWLFGDTVIANLHKAVDAKAARQPPVLDVKPGELMNWSEAQRDKRLSEFAAVFNQWQQKENARLARIRK